MHVFYIPPIKGKFKIHSMVYEIDDELRTYVTHYLELIPAVAKVSQMRPKIAEQFIVTPTNIRTVELISPYSPVSVIIAFEAMRKSC